MSTPRPLTVLHTSDWHLGQALYGCKRTKAFAAFLDWLTNVLCEERVDILLIAGDVFDTGTPSNKAQELYYRFLHRVADTPCRHVVVIAGNHDSPSFLAAPKTLLSAFNIHVVAAITDNPEDEILTLADQDGNPQAIVCAVPYLRDRDIRTVEAGESVEDKERKMVEGIERHYRAVCDLARAKRAALSVPVPLIVLGHLFTAGGKTVEGDGVRQLYVGSLACVPASVFPDDIDYLALGHLHVPQLVGGRDTRRYCGSPLPMGFDEAEQTQNVCLLTVRDGLNTVRPLSVPVFQRLERLRGSWPVIASGIKALAQSDAWLEIVYDDDELIGDLRERVEQAVAGTTLEVLRIRNLRFMERMLHQEDAESLDALDVHDVFERCLNAHQVPEAQRPELRQAYQEAVRSLLETDTRAE